MMDVSGSMGDEQKEIVRIESFWIDAWLQKQYKGLESRYIIHDAVAREVDRETFFHTRESGGTMISSAYKLCSQLIDDHYPPDEWNIYPFHFSDGDNWSMDDTLLCVELLKNEAPAAREHVRVRPGREPVRLGPVHQGPARALRQGRARRHERDPRQGRDRRLHQGVPRARGTEADMSEFALKTALPPYLRDEQNRIEKLAAEAGLDFFPTVFEILTYDQMNEIAAYGGFPNRYPHWRFGMEYERLAKSYEYGLSKIYEMVINNNPSYAYLLEGNSLVDQKLVMAHVYAHVDFFKNNFCFRSTDLDTGGRTVDPVKRPSTLRPEPPLDRQDGEPRLAHAAHRGAAGDQQGRRVHRPLPEPREPHRPARAVQRPARRSGPTTTRSPRRPRSRASARRTTWSPSSTPTEYLEEQRKKIEAEREKAKKFPEHPERDVLHVPPRARAARALGARRPRGHPRGGLLLRAAVADEDHERGLGDVLALAAS